MKLQSCIAQLFPAVVDNSGTAMVVPWCYAGGCATPSEGLPCAVAVNALAEWDGGMVLVSHDFRLISQVANEIW